MLIVAQSYLFIIQFEISLFQTQYCTVLYPQKIPKKKKFKQLKPENVWQSIVFANVFFILSFYFFFIFSFSF